MTDPTSTPDASQLDALLGAYALDALDAADRARVETYLARNPDAKTQATQTYRRILELFPQSRSAALARERIGA